MEQNDKDCMSMMTVVMGAIAAIGIAAFFVAGNLGDSIAEKPNDSPEAMAERIQPVAMSVAQGEAAAEEVVVAAAPAEATAAVAAVSGKDLYTQACFACHGTGAAGAPKLGDTAAWAPRIAAGMDSLLNTAIKGKGAMPAKGGRADLSDDAIKSIVDYMVAQSQ